MIKKSISIILFFFLVLPALSHAKTRVEWTTEVWDKVAETNKTGAYFDLLAAIFNTDEFELHHRFLPYQRGVKYLRENRVDIISICTPMAEFITPKYPWAQESFGVLYDKNSFKDWDGIKTLTDKRISVQKSLSIVPVVEQIDGEFIYTSQKSTALQLLERKRVDALLDVYINIKQEVEKNKQLTMTDFSFKPLTIMTCHPGFSATARGQMLKEYWDKGIENLLKTDKLKLIYQKWQMEYPNYHGTSYSNKSH